MKITISLHILFICFICQNIIANSDNIKFRNIDYNKGLSNNQVHCIYKDHHGFLWVGTMDGLNRYDGHEFKVFKHNPQDSTSLRDNFVLKVLEDEKDFLWILSRNSSLCFYDQKNERFLSERPLLKKNISIPQNNISDINKDSSGRIWITNDFFGIYIYDFKSDSVIHLKSNTMENNSISSNSISSMTEDNQGNYWIINQHGVIEKLNSKTLKVIERIPVFTKEIDNNENFRIFIDNDNDIWIYSESKSLGIKHYNTSSNKIRHYKRESSHFPLANNVVKGIVQDKKGLIYIGMDHGGLNIINKKTNIVESVKNIKGDPSSLSDNSINTLYYDNSGIIWVGMYKGGLASYHPDFFKFKHYSNNPVSTKGLSFSDINCFTEDKKGNIWIGSNGGGLLVFNPKKQSFNKFTYKILNTINNEKDVIISLLYDSKERLWIGTYFDGLYMVEGDNITHFKHNPKKPESISNDRIWSILEDTDKNIWIGTLGDGVDLFDSTNNSFIHYRAGSINSVGSDFVFSIEEDKKGNIWFATIYGVTVFTKSSKRFYTYLNDVQNSKSLSNNKSTVVKCDSRGWCWIGTYDGLNLYDPENYCFRRFRTEDGLPDNSILSIEEDNKGNLWIGTPNGLSNLNIGKISNIWDFEYNFKSYDVSDGLQSNLFNERASFKTRGGNLIFGGINGFNIFNLNKLKSEQINKKLVLFGFELFNKSVKPGDVINGRKILHQSILSTKEIVLKHNENFFSINFTALDFFHPQKLVYQYKLDGFNDSWFEADPKFKKATFTNLNHGTYTFRARVSADGRNWSKEQVRLTIKILPPIWATQWAIIIYGILFFAFLFILRLITLRKERLKHQQEFEQKEILRKNELNQLKLEFFTNISHEFRTPLTLILSPLNKIINNLNDDRQKKQLEIVEKNAKRLLKLVNQLLDFRKMEVDKLSITPSIGDIVVFIKDIVDSFDDYSADKQIQLNFESELPKLQCFFDHDKIEKVISNLLSNAFKFTPENGSIKVEIKTDKNSTSTPQKILIIVSDTGIGISSLNINRIFDRFYQDNEGKKGKFQGSGIGLALTKEYIALHKGSVTAESQPNKGSSFIIKLPIYTQKSSINKNEVFKTDSTTIKSEVNEHRINEDNLKPLVMIIEDNEDLRFYLKENLRDSYNIVEADNGRVALKLIEEKKKPDLIVSDVMMPEMNGIELCDKIKSDEKYSHIPLILLTARTTTEQKIEGLQVGADDYITKPFSFEILEAKIKNILTYRKKLHDSFTHSKKIEPSEICVTSIDEKLFKKAIKVVEDNMGNSEFTIEKMGELLGISRAHLYNKMMAITGKTPSEFIKIMRLKRASQLLENSQLTISEISYDLGYNGPRYFTKHFKEYYGMTPSQYCKQKKD